MIKRIKSFTNTDDKKRLMSNFLSLSILQGANYILPLITFPYLVRVIGVEYFGLLAFATAIITYFALITDYGFSLTATREISTHRDNREKIIEIFSSVMLIKFFLFLLASFLLLVLIFSFEKFRQDWLVYFLTFGSVFGQVLFPIWFFQGMERMKYITYINVASRLLFTVAIFIFIQKEEDFYIVPLLNSLSFIASGLYSLYLVKKDFQIEFQSQSFHTIKPYVVDGWHIFISRFGVNLYKSNAILVLGLFSSELIVGYFAIAKKIVDVINQIASIISRTLFPYVVKHYEINKVYIKFLVKLATVILSYTFLIFLILSLFPEFISTIISGTVYKELVVSIEIMALVPLIIAINIPAVHALLVGKQDKYFSKSVLLGGVVDLFLLFLLIPNYGYIGAAITVLMTELFVTLLLYYYAIKLFKGKL